MPFIVYTAEADSDSLISTFKMGVTDYIIDECRPSSVKTLAEKTRKAVEAHGGTISVSTKVGKGTAFRVTLPLTPLKDTTPPKKQRLDEPRSRAP